MARLSIDPTPNPNSLKFSLPGVKIIDAGLESFSSVEEAQRHPLGSALFTIEGVSNVFIVPQFATITKEPGADWDEIVPRVEEILGTLGQ